MKGTITQAMMMYFAMGGGYVKLPRRFVNTKPPWYKTQLTKSQRNHLSYDEQQLLRKKIWEANNEKESRNENQ